MVHFGKNYIDIITMGGVAAMPVMGNIPGALISIAAGVVVTVILLAIFKKESKEEVGDASDEEIDIKIEL